MIAFERFDIGHWHAHFVSPAATAMRLPSQPFTVYEMDKVQVKQRDPNFIDQNERRRKTQIETTMKYGNWIRDQANNLGLKILNARPEATLISRAYDLLQIPH